MPTTKEYFRDVILQRLALKDARDGISAFIPATSKKKIAYNLALRRSQDYPCHRAGDPELRLLEVDVARMKAYSLPLVYSVKELKESLDLGMLHSDVDVSHRYFVASDFWKGAIVREMSLNEIRAENDCTD